MSAKAHIPISYPNLQPLPFERPRLHVFDSVENFSLLDFLENVFVVFILKFSIFFLPECCDMEYISKADNENQRTRHVYTHLQADVDVGQCPFVKNINGSKMQRNALI